MASNAKAMQYRLRGIGIRPDVAHSIVAEVQKWIKCCGEEHTVGRLKLIKLDLLHHFAGIPPAPREIGDSWYKLVKGVPKGAFAPLFRMSKRDFKKAWNAVLIYTGITFDHPKLKVTERQWRKAISSIHRADLTTEVFVEGLKLVLSSPISKLNVEVASDTGSPLVDFHASDSRRAPYDLKTVPEPEGIYTGLKVLQMRPMWTIQNMDILSGTLRGIEELVMPELRLNLIDEMKATGEPDYEERPDMGQIALIQEPGYKLRSAANPIRLYQAALTPLYEALSDTLRKIPQDHTFDQETGIEAMQTCLKEGRRVWCTDLSNASDNLPLEFQLHLLGKMGVSTRWLQFFKSCCRGDWIVMLEKHSDVWRRVRWTVGQPLGLKPSFASFTLCHHAIVQALYMREYPDTPVSDYEYGIVGDDFWTSSSRVAQAYVDYMNLIGVPVQNQKVLAAPSTGEFLGRIVTPDRVYQGFKWKGRCSDESFVDLLRNLGPTALCLLRPRQRRLVEFIAELPEPYGLGWNPMGKTLEERLTPEVERIFSQEERLRSFRRRAARIHSDFYRSPWLGTPIRPRNIDREWLSSDQEEISLVTDAFPGWESVGMNMLPNISELARESGRFPELAARLRASLLRTSSVETRKQASTLVVLERKVQRMLAR